MFFAAGFNISTPMREMNPEIIRRIIQKRKEDHIKLQSFQITKDVGGLFIIDENKRQWYTPDGPAGRIINPRIYSFDDIIGYELLEDGNTITKGGLGRAIVG